MASSSPLTSAYSSPLSANLDFISRAKHRLYDTFSTPRPWRQIFHYHSLSCPYNLPDAISRLKTNLCYFRMNFAMFILFVLFLSLLWHPFSLIVFLVMMIAWLFLYFLRDEPLVLFSRSVDDRIVLMVLSVLTIGFLLLTGATRNIWISLAIGIGIVVVYSIFRRSNDLFLDEEEGAARGLLSGRTGVLPPFLFDLPLRVFHKY